VFYGRQQTIQTYPVATSGSGTVENETSTGNHSARPTERLPAKSEGVDGKEAEALEDLARLQALTRTLRAAVAESRSADGLPVDVDERENSTSKDVDQQDTQRTTNEDNDDAVDNVNLVIYLLNISSWFSVGVGE